MLSIRIISNMSKFNYMFYLITLKYILQDYFINNVFCHFSVCTCVVHKRCHLSVVTKCPGMKDEVSHLRHYLKYITCRNTYLVKLTLYFENIV